MKQSGGIGVAETGVPTEMPDGSRVGVFYDEFGRQVIFGANLSEGSLDVSEVAPALTSRMLVTLDQLTAPGSSPEINMLDYHNVGFQVKVAAINTSVDVRIEGSMDNTNWFNLDDSGTDVQYTANGTYYIHKDNFSCKYVRFTFVSEVGGTAVTLDVVALLGN